MMVDRNTRLCSKEIQSRIKTALNVIDSESLTYIIMHNPIELLRIESAIKALRELRTNRSGQLYQGRRVT